MFKYFDELYHPKKCNVVDLTYVAMFCAFHRIPVHKLWKKSADSSQAQPHKEYKLLLKKLVLKEIHAIRFAYAGKMHVCIMSWRKIPFSMSQTPL